MLLNQLALILCLILMFGTKMAVMTAAKRGDMRQVRALQFLRIGLSLSACSYMLRLIAAPGSLASFGSFLCCLGGSLLIWIGFREHLALMRERVARLREEQIERYDAGDTFPAEAGLPCLTSGAHQVLRHAEALAWEQRRCVDSDHLLLGLLTVSENTGAHVLERLGVSRESLYRTLGQTDASLIVSGPLRVGAEEPPLTARARQVFALAAQEAHRFDKEAVGTEHLLLGLVLAGTGDAASALFQAGATADGIRDVIQKNAVRD